MFQRRHIFSAALRCIAHPALALGLLLVLPFNLAATAVADDSLPPPPGAIDTSAPRYAQNFELRQFPGYRLLIVRNTHRQSDATLRYALVSKGQPLPKSLPKNAQIVRTPVERVVVMETVYLGYLAALGKIDTVVGAATTDYISHPEIRQRVARGEIAKVQSGQNIRVEKMLLLQPDLILTSVSGDPAFDLPPKLERTGLPVVLCADYMERHPLARSEWIRFIAAFFEADAAADAQFERTATRYQSLVALTTATDHRPTVFCDAPYSGTWHVPGGESYTARLIADAGAAYMWADTASAGSLPLDTERVFLKAARADFWINPGPHQNLPALFAADPRFQKFKAAQTGRIYNNTRQVKHGLANPIWETGITQPDEVLADLIQIFHPELLPEREFIYYEKLK